MSWFRVAKPASTTRHLLTTLLQIAGFWGTFLGVLPALVARASQACGIEPLRTPAPAGSGGALFLAASALGLWSAWTMAVHGRGTPLPLATAREFVASGPYRWLRNPMALAGIAQGVGVGMLRDDAWVVLYALTGGLLWHHVARPAEERDLAARFGRAFVAYRERVPLWAPRCVPRPVERVVGSLLVFWGAILFAGACLHRQHVWPVAAWSALGVLPGLALTSSARGLSHPRTAHAQDAAANATTSGQSPAKSSPSAS